MYKIRDKAEYNKMKINKILEEKRVTVSFEVFPPKEWAKIDDTKAVIAEMVKDKPAWMSVTYGAAGTASGFTTEIARSVMQGGITALSHLTCLTSSKEKIDSVLDELEANNVENILALRGDIPKDFVRVSESGIKTNEDMRFVRSCGADAVLIGETLMRSGNVNEAMAELLRGIE